MATQVSRVEVLDFKLFPQKLKAGAIGMVYGKITHGFTTNFFSELIYPFQLDDKGRPVVSVQTAIRSIKYSMASEILVAMQYLQGSEWFEKQVEFTTVGLEPFEEIEVSGWSAEWDQSARIDLAYYLEDVCSELEMSDREFSKDWFYAKACHLYFLESEIPDVAMNIGILLSQLWWKSDLEEIAVRGRANAESLERANSARKDLSAKQSQAKNDLIVAYWFEALKELGPETMRRDSNAAQAIYAIVSQQRPRELQIKATGETIGVEAIRKRISSIRKLGKLG
ncbi:MAG: hypothetical protein AB8B58_00940 [Roseobacter sp.]